jgi:hypothetical protein
LFTLHVSLLTHFTDRPDSGSQNPPLSHFSPRSILPFPHCPTGVRELLLLVNLLQSTQVGSFALS